MRYSDRASEWFDNCKAQKRPYGHIQNGLLIITTITDESGRVSPRISERGHVEYLVINPHNRTMTIKGTVHSRYNHVVWEDQDLLGEDGQNIEFIEKIAPTRAGMPLFQETEWRTAFRIVSAGRETVRTKVGSNFADSHFKAELSGGTKSSLKGNISGMTVIDHKGLAQLLQMTDEFDIPKWQVVPGYVRWDENNYNILCNHRRLILRELKTPGNSWKLRVIWGTSGGGKTSLPVCIAKHQSIPYQVVDISNAGEFPDREALLEKLESIRGVNPPYLCIIDEIDKRPNESWIFPTLLGFLNDKTICRKDNRDGGYVCLLIGSAQAGYEAWKKTMSSNAGVNDVFSRAHPDIIEIPSCTEKEQLGIALSHIAYDAQSRSKRIDLVDKLGLFYVLCSTSNPRQIKQLIVEAVEKVPQDDNKLLYADFFNREKFSKALNFPDKNAELAAQLDDKQVFIKY